MLRTLRNLAILGLVLAFTGDPVGAAVQACGSCSGDCTYGGDDLGCGGSFTYCMEGGCFSYICADPTDGMGTICPE